MNLLCICPIGIGNYLMCYPAFHVLKKRRPDISLHLLALRGGISAIARHDALWDSIETFDPTKIKKNIPMAFSVLAKLCAKKFDASCSFFPSNTWQYHLLPLLSGIKERYAFKYAKKRISGLSFFSNHTIPVNAFLHDVNQNLALTGFYLGQDVSGEEIVFPVYHTDEDIRWARDYMGSHAKKDRCIAVHPGSSIDNGMDVKRWSPQKFAMLADQICKVFNAQVFIVGGPDESAVKKQVGKSMTEPFDIVEPVSLQKTAALLKHCEFALCNDSGIMHMAACAGVPTAGIFGPTDEKRNGPFGNKTFVVRKQMDGFPLWTAENVGSRKCPRGIDPKASLEALTSDEAWKQLKPWLQKNLHF